MPEPAPSGAPAGYPLGAQVTARELAGDLHPVLRRLRETEPVSWLPALNGWLVTRADLAERVLRAPADFTVDDPRFTTARIVGPSMLSLDGQAHRQHRDPFARALRSAATRSRLAEAAASKARELVTVLASGRRPGQAGPGQAELRRGLAGQLAVAVMADMLGLDVAPTRLLAWYDAIVAGVSALSAASGPADAGGPADASGPATRPPAARAPAARAPAAGGPVADEPALGPPEHAGAAAPGPGAALLVASAEAAFRELSDCVEQTLTRPARPSVLTAAAESLTPGEVVSNAAVLLFGGIETTEGMICNAVWFLLRDAAALRAVLADRQLVGNVVEESLRLEPAAAVVDRYACAAISLGEASIRQGDLVTVSLAGANRDPAVFPDPDRFDPHRENARRNWAFATGPHFCIGAELARTEATAAVAALLDQLPGLHLDPDRPAAPRGLVFRKPAALYVRWTA